MGKSTFLIINCRNTFFFKINRKNIIYCEADSKRTIIYTITNNRIIIPCLLKRIEEQLTGDNFYRISRKHIINLYNCTQIIRKPIPKVILIDEIQLQIPRRNVKYLLNKLGLLTIHSDM